MATITTTATPIAPYREACGWEKIRPTRIDPRDTTAPMPMSASTPHFTQAVTSSAKPCIPGGAAGQTAAVISVGVAVAGPAPSTRNPARTNTTLDAARTTTAVLLRPMVTGSPPPGPGARPTTGRRPPLASAVGRPAAPQSAVAGRSAPEPPARAIATHQASDRS